MHVYSACFVVTCKGDSSLACDVRANVRMCFENFVLAYHRRQAVTLPSYTHFFSPSSICLYACMARSLVVSIRTKTRNALAAQCMLSSNVRFPISLPLAPGVHHRIALRAERHVAGDAKVQLDAATLATDDAAARRRCHCRTNLSPLSFGYIVVFLSVLGVPCFEQTRSSSNPAKRPRPRALSLSPSPSESFLPHFLSCSLSLSPLLSLSRSLSLG